MTTKNQILNFIRRMPDDVSEEQVIEGLFLLRKVRIGLAQADAGDVVSHEEVEREFLDKK